MQQKPPLTAGLWQQGCKQGRHLDKMCSVVDDDVARSQLTLYNGKALAKSREDATWGSQRVSKRRWSLSLRPSKGPQHSSAEEKAPHCFPCSIYCPPLASLAGCF